MITLMKMPIRHGSAPLRVARGHFATNHSHINYYVDITYQKTRLSEAKDSAQQLVANFVNDTPVDTILCLDGTGVVGTCLAQELTKSGFRTINAHETIYILEPEYNANSQIIFRDNTQGMIRGKHVLVLMASVTTGYTAKRALEAITYYGGTVAGVAAIYSAVDQVEGYPVHRGAAAAGHIQVHRGIDDPHDGIFGVLQLIFQVICWVGAAQRKRLSQFKVVLILYLLINDTFIRRLG